MELDDQVKNAYCESASGMRTGDSVAEIEGIRRYIRTAGTVVVPSRNPGKVTVINEVLGQYGLSLAAHLPCETTCCDLCRMPAISKALMALDSTSCDLVIARGRLGLPGSGSMLVIMDGKGRILTVGLSPSHALHGKPVADAVRDEMVMALERTGLRPKE